MLTQRKGKYCILWIQWMTVFQKVPKPNFQKLIFYVKNHWIFFIFDRKLRSGLCMSFFLLLCRDFFKFLYEIRKLESLFLDKKTRKILSWIRKLKSLILHEKTESLIRNMEDYVPNFCLMSLMSAQYPQNLPNVPNVCLISRMSPISA
jgi:hypothetical protein